MKVGGRRRRWSPDAEVIRALAGLLSETGLSEIEYAVGDHRIRVARESAGRTPCRRDQRLRQRACAIAGRGGGEAPPAAAAGGNGASTHPGTVTSPMVGVAYLAPQPGDAAVRAGRRHDQQGPDRC